MDAYIPDNPFRNRDSRFQSGKRNRHRRVDRFTLKGFQHNESDDVYLCPRRKILKLSAKIVVRSAWDSTVELLLLVEIFFAAVRELTWPENRARIEELEDMFDRTRFFRKFT